MYSFEWKSFYGGLIQGKAIEWPLNGQFHVILTSRTDIREMEDNVNDHDKTLLKTCML